MTTVTGATSTSATSAAAAAASAASTTKTDAETATLDYNSFLQLLVAQMKNQDPLNPTDATAQLSQLASFSNVEQSIKSNQKLASLVTSSSLTQANVLIGRTLTSSDNSVTGIVKSVQVTDTGVVATLTDGKTVNVGTGVTIE